MVPWTSAESLQLAHSGLSAPFKKAAPFGCRTDIFRVGSNRPLLTQLGSERYLIRGAHLAYFNIKIHVFESPVCIPMDRLKDLYRFSV